MKIKDIISVRSGKRNLSDQKMELWRQNLLSAKELLLIMLHILELREETWMKFLAKEPENEDLCWVVCHIESLRVSAWRMLLERGLEKENLLYIIVHLRNRKFLNYKVWPLLEKRGDLTKDDIKKVLKNPKTDSYTRRDAERLLKPKKGKSFAPPWLCNLPPKNP